MNRRNFIMGVSTMSLMSFSVFSPLNKAKAMDLSKILGSSSKDDKFPFKLTDKEWKERLTPEQYRILRSEGTELSCSSPLNGVEGEGKFYCVGCGHLLFSTDTKFDSKTGWPSFYQPENDYAVGTDTDYKLGYPRTEVHCANCGGHLGHVFNDGPKPTGQRYCINGVAMEFAREEG